MADSPIGEIPILITGDFSELETAITEAASAAEEGASQIADAFDIPSLGDDAVASINEIAQAAEEAASSVSSLSDTGDLSAVAEQADTAATSLSELGNAAEQSSHSIHDAGDASSEAGEQAEEAEGGFEGFAEQLLAVGEALAITEGLKELATEAEEAADKITVATIALTAITGSAGLAKETIAGLEEVGTSEGLSMPSLLTAATRMQQMLGPAANVTELLESIGNGAQAMGTDITAAAQRFDQMASSGTASARTMMSLGLSLTGLASAINEVSGTEAANEQNAAAMFKAMDQSQRIQVLQTAMEGLAGVAGQVAQQTFGAQWTILANQWETVMVEAGEALLPIVTELNNLLKTDILPFIQEVAKDFNELPGPIRDAAVAAALITTALAAGALAAGALAIPLGALGELLPSVVGLMTTLGIVAQTTAAAEGEEAIAATANAAAHSAAAEAMGVEAIAAEGAAAATVTAGEGAAAAGEGAAAAGAEFTLFGVGIGPVAVAAAALGAVFAGLNFSGAIDQFEQLGPAIKGNSDLWNQLEANVKSAASSITKDLVDAGTAVNSFAVGAIPGMASLTTWIQNLAQYTPQATSVLKEFALALSGIGIPAQQTVNALNDLGENAATMDPILKSFNQDLQAVPPAFALSKTAVDSFSTGLTTLITKQSQANALVDSTRTTMQEAAAALAAGTISQTVYNAAVVAYDNAVQAAIPHGKDFASTVAGIEQAAQKAQQAFQSSLAVYQQLAANFDGSAQSAAVLDEAYTKLEASAKKAGQTFADSTGILTQWQTQAKQTAAVAEQAAIAMALIQTAANNGETSITDLLDVYTKWQAAAKAAGEVSVQSAGQVAQLTNAVLLQEGGLQQNIQAWSDLNKQATTDQAAMVGSQNAFKLVSSEAATLGVNIQQVGSGFQVSAKEATPAANAMVALLVQMMNQAGLTTETIQKGIPVYTDGATGVTVYGKALQQTIGTVVDAKTGIVELNAVLPEHADAFNKAAAAAAAHAQALYGVQSAALNVQPYLFNVTEATQKLTQAGQGTVNTLENAISVFQNLATQSNLTIGQQVALENAFKQVQSAGTALGLQVQFVNGQLVVTSQNGNSASTALQGFLQQINSLTSSTPASTAAQDALAQSIKNVGAAAQEAASEIGSFAQDEAAMSGGGGSSGGGGGAGGFTPLTSLEMIAASGQQITSQEAGAAGMVLTGNNQLQTIDAYNAQVEQLVSNLNTEFGTTGKYVEQVGSYIDQFGNKIEFAQEVLNTNYTPATQAAATSTAALASSATSATEAVTQYTAGMNLAVPSTTSSTAAVQQFTDSVNNGNDSLGVSVDSLGNWTSTLQSTGQSIQTAGAPTAQALESLGLSASTAQNLIALWNTTQEGATTATDTATTATTALATAASTAAGALQGVAEVSNSMQPSGTAASPTSGSTFIPGANVSAPNFVPLSQSATNPAPPGTPVNPSQPVNQVSNPALDYTYVQAVVDGVSGWLLKYTPYEGNATAATTGGANFASYSANGSSAGYWAINPSTGIMTSEQGQMPMSQVPLGEGAAGSTAGLTATQSALAALASSSFIGAPGFSGNPQLGAQPTTMTNSNNTNNQFTINVNAATVVGNNGAQQLAQMIQTQITQMLRQNAGLKL